MAFKKREKKGELEKKEREEVIAEQHTHTHIGQQGGRKK